MADLIINGFDAYEAFGVRMDVGFLDELGGSAPLKEYVTNNSRLKHGVQYADITPKINERSLTLTFTLSGDDKTDYIHKKSAFYQVLMQGGVSIQVPANSPEIFHLRYKNSVSYSQNRARTFGKLAVKFVEPDPSMRE